VVNILSPDISFMFLVGYISNPLILLDSRFNEDTRRVLANNGLIFTQETEIFDGNSC